MDARASGCRRDEICYLRRAEIKVHSIDIPGERTKNGHAHSIPFTPMIRKVLDALPKRGQFTLTGNGAGLGGHSKARVAIEPPDLPHWTFHDLRRSSATGLAKLGIQINVTERCLNHISGVGKGFLVQIYNMHNYAPEMRAAFEMWSAHVESLVATAKKAAA